MIKNRVFMLGLGTGLVIGAVLLQLMMLGERSMSSTLPQEQQWTKEQIEQGAKSLNLTVVDDEEERMTEEQWKEKMKKDNGDTSATSVVPPTKTEAAQKPKSPQNPDKPKPENNTSNEASPTIKKPAIPKNADPVQIRYEITKGSNLSHVADGLKQAGVITDKQAFIKAATAKKINQSIQMGTYTFKAGENYQSIIKKISEKPSSDHK